ncbi:hypothetical protein QZH56_14405 [Streptomyces olivoreticuli]|uniref:hypothetical protein n=1 Tax=Streptomyces olivoreticuli TaxID=68246 RepID=UPI002659166A|nr:hypothetical protein [Streptomyces olivoreticuli]WKK26675.1 hypothetical protein QZH56_14405 [Streptomyces olivoreticuli]
MATTQDLRKAATDTAYAAAGLADFTAEKIGQAVAEAPERFEQLRNTDPKALQEKVTQRAKETQATVTAKFTEIVSTFDNDAKKLGQSAQDLLLQGVGQAVGYAAKAGEQYEKFAERGRVAVKTWRGEAAEEVADIAVAIEPESADSTGSEAKPADGAASDAQGDDAKPAAARKPAARKPAAAKKSDAKSDDQ